MTEASLLSEIKGIGDALVKKYAVLGIRTVGDLIQNFPRRYDDYSNVTPIKSTRPGLVSIKGEIKQVAGRYARRGMHITEAVVSDATGSVRLIWFNQPYRAASIKQGQQYYISGKYELSHQRFSIQNPSVELANSFPVNTARIVPVYRETKGLSSQQIRKSVREVLDVIRASNETLPNWLLAEQKLMSRAEAVEAIHFPETTEQCQEARRRIGFEEVYSLSLASLLNKYELLQDKALAIGFDKKLAQQFVKSLPFQLTDAQRAAAWRIYQDMEQTTPMNRMIEGDVGSGKTVVAAMASVMAMAAGYQVAFMAPTELLARQHATTLYNLLEPLGLQDKLVLLIGGMTAKQKQIAQAAVADSSAQLIVGTHALIQEKVDMHELGLVVIDEQHRFGVEQRTKLMAKAGHMPHLLSLTATPIPRSLALTLYGELDISIIDTKPPGRKPIKTEICSPVSRGALYAKVDAELEAGRQMFVVCPLISDSETLKVQSAENVFEAHTKRDFKHRRVAMLHGKMKSAEKQAIMEQFVQHDIDILISTTVIEVGVDVPNASIMLVESAERFGLAQIHQLRGRVGRGSHQGYCYLMMSDTNTPPPRLRALERSQDGFRLAELDLEIRGPGAIYGTMQHGALDLRVASLTDTKLIAEARAAAQATIAKGVNLLEYKELFKNVTRLRAVTNLN